MPTIEGATGRFLLQQMASVAELEAGMIGERTRKALAAAKARGQKLGGFRGRAGTAEDATNCIPTTPIDAFVGGGYPPRWLMQKSQDARRAIIAASPVMFQLGTSPFRRRLARAGKRPASQARP
jgi:Resolvase, N terminal domain